MILLEEHLHHCRVTKRTDFIRISIETLKRSQVFGIGGEVFELLADRNFRDTSVVSEVLCSCKLGKIFRRLVGVTYLVKSRQTAFTFVVNSPSDEIESGVFLRIAEVEAHVAVDIRSTSVEARDLDRGHATQHSVETDFEETFGVERSVDNVIGGGDLAGLVDERHVGGENFVESISNSHLLRGSDGLTVDESRLEGIRVIRIQL